MPQLVEHPEEHPLAQVTGTIGSWSRWKEVWEASPMAEQKIGLLHFLFHIHTVGWEESIQRIYFCLNIADGYNAAWNFRLPDEDRERRFKLEKSPGRSLSLSEVRQRVARKAFEVLANAILKNRALDSNSYPSWCFIVEHPELLDKLLWFFRVDDEARMGNLPCNRGEHEVYSVITRRFLIDLVRFAWEFRYFGKYEVDSDRVIQANFRVRRPQFIELLWSLGEMDILLNPVFQFDQACWFKLEELSFRKDLYMQTEGEHGHWGRECRKPTTLAEAHYGGSWPAVVLTHRRIVAEEEERFARLRELSEREEALAAERATLETKK